MINRYYNYPYYRSEKTLPPPPPVKPPIPSKPPKKKFCFKALKKETCTSLNDVECFLNNFTNTLKYIKLIKLLK